MKFNSTRLKLKSMTTVYSSLLVSLFIFNVSALAQGMSSGPTAERKTEPRLIPGVPGKDAMGGSLGTPSGSAGNSGGSVMLAYCLAERNQIAKLTELNRLLEEKVSELSKKTDKSQVAQKTGDKK